MAITRKPTWRHLHEVNPGLFPSVMELAEDPGWMGMVLRTLPMEILKDADRCPDPWADLINNNFVPATTKGAFRACASLVPAAIRLSHIMQGVATVRSDRMEKLQKAGTDQEREEHLTRILPGIFRTHGLKETHLWKDHPEFAAELKARHGAWERQMRKKHGKAWKSPAAERPEVVIAMVCYWIRWAGDLPGFCFFSDAALMDLLFVKGAYGRDPKAGIDVDAHRHLRHRLGLRQAHREDPLVSAVIQDRRTHRVGLVLDSARSLQWSREIPKAPKEVLWIRF